MSTSGFSRVISFFNEPRVRSIPLNDESLIRVLLPVIVGYHLQAILVCLPNTRLARLALAVTVIPLIWRTGMDLDVAAGEDAKFGNMGLVLGMFVTGIRTAKWALSPSPYYKIHESNLQVSWSRRILNSFDLLLGIRGIGWNWSKGLHIPEQTRPTASKASFLLRTTISTVFHAVAFDLTHYHIQTIEPFNLYCSKGTSVFNENLPPLQRYLLSSYITCLLGMLIYFALTAAYEALTLVGVLILQQEPSQWPPMFGKPWASTSQHHFWAEGWHQSFRECFLFFGGKPGYYIGGRAGGVLGVFFVSGLAHYVALWALGQGSDWRILYLFLIFGVGVILEDMWKRLTGRPVGGVFGWLWTFTWIIGWTNIGLDAFAQKGLFAIKIWPENARPGELLFGSLSMDRC